MSLDTAVVLAGGEGRRLRPLTKNRPKPMLPAGNRPILEHVLDTLVDAGVERIVLVVGYKRDRVQEHFGPTYRDVPLEYAVQEKELGSGHALLQAREYVDESLLVLNGDRVIDPGIVTDVADAFGDRGEPTMAVMEHPEAHTFGAVRLDGDRVTELVEKPLAGEYRLINAGVYAFTPDIFDGLAETPKREGELDLTAAISRRIDADEPVWGVRTDGLWADATFPWDLLFITRSVLHTDRVTEPESEDTLHVAPSAIVHPDATLRAPLVVGPDCEVGPNAVVGPDSALGRNVTVGANATVERSVLDADTRVGPGSTLVECVTGEDVNLGANTTVPGGPADVALDDRVYRDQQLGAVFADRVDARGGVTAEPGALVGPNATLGTGVNVRGRVDEDSEVVR
ncbi:sugar phosphate nucleotidyltransferase [Haloglomus halophilum]|uniref:sugar phosphate nucleotidyltransferase n=1 Tax=Haloglomus halophilum TaxID=2962672 RepID=UPI0020C9E4C9|nr:sugar phosphate nucleotidyltransferase [Haloglomus halophilum]